MLAVVIPARNEAARIQNVVRQSLKLKAGLVIPVLNGCTDMTMEMVRRLGDARVRPVQFKEPLGLDVPRIAGAQAALEAGARGVLFLDGDLDGQLLGRLAILVERVRRGETDLSLSDCYAGTPVPSRQTTARSVYTARLALNEALGRPDLGAAIPSHGPVAVSRRLLEALPPAAIGVPPLMQALACRAGLGVEVGACIPHKELGSAQRDREHRQKVAETIIGDCLQASGGDRRGHMGYHEARRFDLLGLQPPEGVTLAMSESSGED
ncbi:MAG TPA: glycosyltransferase family 2 protein [Symbiobacteriaceae bacterium]|nr:glycosyltransferase family 2 protein [Symbiobacteriaceae bacterium]